MRHKIFAVPSVLLTAFILWKYPPEMRRFEVEASPSSLSQTHFSSISSDSCFNALGEMERVEDIMTERAYGQKLNPISDDSLEKAYWSLVDIVGNVDCVRTVARKFRPEDPNMNEVRAATWQRWLRHRKH